MIEDYSPARVLRDLHAGPHTKKELTAQQVAKFATARPKQYRTVLRQLNYRMLDAQFKSPGKDMISPYARFVESWRGDLNDDALEYFVGTIEVYSEAIGNQFHHLDWETPKNAATIVEKLQEAMPNAESVRGLAWLTLLGQVQSTYSRNEAAITFSTIRSHKHVELVSEFFWDSGALTYYSELEIAQNRRELPSLSGIQNWCHGGAQKSNQAIVISMDSNFFRTYAPMILFNAQQLPEIDFILILCSTADAAQQLYEDADTYLSGLSVLNHQNKPQNIHFRAVSTPAWVQNERTFYATARFVALPELLETYDNIYTMDADLFVVQNPHQFLSSVSAMSLGFPKTKGLLGVPPWRRFMAGNLVANKKAADSEALNRLLNYLSVGLAAPKSWMLDQNALTFSAETKASDAPAVITRRPAVTGNFMSLWERNFRATLAH